MADRNYRVVAVTGGQVVVELESGARLEAGRPSCFGTWGLSRKEAAIVRRGLTRSGKDRRPQKGEER